MAYTYNNLPVLSKIKIGETPYYLKDADVRAILDTYGNAVTYNVVETVAVDSKDLATAGAVAAYVEQNLVSLGNALHFRGVVDSLDAVENPADGDVVLVGVKEYVYSGGEWHELGDEAIYETSTHAAATYVPKTLTIATLDLADDISVEELQNALALKALAYKDNASATLADYATGITGVEYKPAGTVSVEVGTTSTAMESTGTFKPAGEVTGSTIAAGSVTIARNEESGVQITGSVSTPTITVTPNTASVQHIDSVGSLPTYTAAQYTAPSVNETKSAFASEGLVAALDTEDSEMLVFSAAGTAEALTATNFNAGSYTDAEFNAGSLPTLGEAQQVVTGIASAVSSEISFTGDKFAASFSGTESAITASFAGQDGAVSVSGNYDKATSATGSFDGTSATITPTLEVGTKVITVE